MSVYMRYHNSVLFHLIHFVITHNTAAIVKCAAIWRMEMKKLKKLSLVLCCPGYFEQCPVIILYLVFKFQCQFVY